MSYDAKVIADSISPHGVRLTTMQVRYPHAIHKDMLRHRIQSPGYESFRAQPPENIIAALAAGEGFKPDAFALREKGMGQGAELDTDAQIRLSSLWDHHVGQACGLAEEFLRHDVAKQQVNFLLQDLTWITGIITATEWDNFWALRLELKPDGSPMARPEVYKIASLMREAFDASMPRQATGGPTWWHLPFITDLEVEEAIADVQSELEEEDAQRFLARVSAGRCARVSYARQDQDETMKASVERADRLLANGHLSPFEHQARPLALDDLHDPRYSHKLMMPVTLAGTLDGLNSFRQKQLSRIWAGNFRGWLQLRKTLPGEENYAMVKMEAGVA